MRRNSFQNLAVPPISRAFLVSPNPLSREDFAVKKAVTTGRTGATKGEKSGLQNVDSKRGFEQKRAVFPRRDMVAVGREIAANRASKERNSLVFPHVISRVKRSDVGFSEKLGDVVGKPLELV